MESVLVSTTDSILGFMKGLRGRVEATLIFMMCGVPQTIETLKSKYRSG